MRHSAVPLAATLAACCLTATAAAQTAPTDRPPIDAPDQRVVRATATGRAPTLDGRLEEPEWELAEPTTGFTQSEPTEGQPLTERTVVRVLFDRDNLYVAAYCYDSDAASIIINELKRDFDAQESDAFGLAIDVLLDRRNSFSFFTNPGSARRDSQSLEDGRYINLQWDGVWHVASAVHADGWVTEMSIPFKTLGLRAESIEAMGINFKRRVRRKNEEGYWSPIPRRFTVNYMSLAGTLTGLGETSGGRGIRVKPFVTFDVRSEGAPPADKAKVGLDARYRVSAGIALDLTVNTDFSHVEADTQQINLTRFSLFFPEKREFFLENSAIFGFGDVPNERSATTRSEDTQLFYTRRIGLSRDGQPLPLLGGGRLSGRSGPWSIGLLSIYQDEERDVAGNLFTVARVRRDLFSQSDIGAIFVGREGDGSGDYNRSYGVDLNLRSGPNWTANGYWAVTTGPELTRGNDQKKVSTKWDDGFFDAQFIFADIGPNFSPEVGFVPRTDVRSYYMKAGLRPRSATGFVREWNPHINWKVFTDHGNLTLTRDQHYAVTLSFRDGASLEVSHNPQFERLVVPFELRPGVMIPVGEYPWNEGRVKYSSDKSKLLSATLDVTRGGFYGGDRLSADMGITVLLKPRLAASLNYQRNTVDLPLGRVRADLWVLRGLYSVNPDLYVDALVQYDIETRRVLTTARFNFTYRPLSDFSIVVNDNRVTGGSALAPEPARALIVKYTRLMQF
jgi:hypothetical protein